MSAYGSVVRWVFETLESDPLLTAIAPDTFEGVAPAQARYPLIQITPATDPLVLRGSNGPVWTAVELGIRVWGATPTAQGSSAVDLEEAVDRITALLDGHPPVDTGYVAIRSCVVVRETAPQSYEEKGLMKRTRGVVVLVHAAASR